LRLKALLNRPIEPGFYARQRLAFAVKPTASRRFSFIEPMKALPVEKLPESDWLYEIRHDGYRALAFAAAPGSKFKITKSQEFVIGGYTLPEGSRKYFGSLPVGYNIPDALRFAGRVGTGFSEKLLGSIDAQLQKLKRPTCPFINLPEKSKGR
jgi:ATP-dependent DNA ligase